MATACQSLLYAQVSVLVVSMSRLPPFGTPAFSGKLTTPPRPPRQGRVAPSQAGQPSRDTPGALVCQRRAPPSPSVHLRPSPPVLEQSLPRALQWHASLLGRRPSTTRGPDERLARARPPAAARGFRAGSPDGSVGRTCRQPAAPRSACGDPVLLKPREPATQGGRGRLCWLVPHSYGRRRALPAGLGFLLQQPRPPVA